ncbi:MAG: hypothetical protein DWQ47_07880 [Acidobacteria bacterium]|nr:MAG: hypothetical protein DWQ32_15980 [Acidobacteriota bacterium]REJ99163.1 MAG: hypothetical protein DWQ38_13995 [Acidobacteriota bacterium]REK16116.1 MAG: hypothetical protein DWQ43_03690 [Acidobacteriota bacterium]REK43797.1 MAG: hypothetical protein DWQ47_07880 [Acidobacteriota bacterium]
MAIVIEGRTKCPLCSRTVSDRDEIRAFTAFLPKQHKLWRYSDAAFHEDCFSSWEHRRFFEEVWDARNDLWSERPDVPHDSSEARDWYSEFTSSFNDLVEQLSKKHGIS